jgi:hypothetical protein
VRVKMTHTKRNILDLQCRMNERDGAEGSETNVQIGFDWHLDDFPNTS